MLFIFSRIRFSVASASAISIRSWLFQLMRKKLFAALLDHF